MLSPEYIIFISQKSGGRAVVHLLKVSGLAPEPHRLAVKASLGKKKTEPKLPPVAPASYIGV